MMRQRFGAFYAPAVFVAVLLAVLVDGEVRSSSQIPASRPVRVSVSGRVIDETSGAPVPGAVVRMTPYAAVAFTVERFAVPSGPSGETLIVRADMVGQFAFDAVSAGTYWLSTTVPGFVGGVYSQRHPLSEGATFEVSDRAIPGVTLRVWKGAAIEGTATDDRGVPVSAAEVQALPRTFINGQGRYSPSVALQGGRGATDANGRFRIDGLAPSDYILTVRSTTPTRTAEGVRMFPIAIEPDPPVVPFTLSAGQEHQVSLILRPAPVVRVTGSFVGPDGPIAGAEVSLFDQRLRSGWVPATTFATTDVAGRFVMPRVVAGEYVVVASRRGTGRPPEGARPVAPPVPVTTPAGLMLARDATDEARAEYPRRGVYLTTAAEVTVGREDVEVPLVAVAGGRITGRITFTGSEKPAVSLVRRMVVLAESFDDNFAPSSASSLVSENGEFTMNDVRPGRYQLRIAPPTPSWMLRSVLVGGRDLGHAPVVVDGRETTEVVVEFANDKTALAGTIRDRQTRTPRASTAVLFPEAVDRWVENGMSARYLRTATVDARGAYRMEQVLAGDYLLASFGGGDYVDLTNPETFTRLARTAQRVSVRTGDVRTEDLFVD